jgi:methyltransferase (TIGR00027 family)
MRAGRPSRTAEYMALFRALEHARPANARLFADPFARRFLGARLRPLITLSALPGVVDLISGVIDRRWPGARTSAIARTRLIDDRVRAAVADGILQIVLLGSGFDSRPYRLPGLERLPIFEVDHPATLARKRQLVSATLGDVSSRVRFVPTDFNRESVEDTLAPAGFDPGHATLFVWEGVTNYLTERAVDHTLRWCARTAPPSQIIFTYVDRAVLNDPQSFYGTARLFATLEASNERWTFGLDPGRLPAYLAERGLRLDEELGAEDYRARYFGATAATMQGYAFYRVASAYVLAARDATMRRPPLA